MAELMKKTKTKTKIKKKKVKAFHQKSKVFRVTDPKMAVFMWGVSQSITQLSHIAPPITLLENDFKAFGKIKIDNHLFKMGNLPGHFKFKEYMPLVFRNLRERFGVDEKLFANTFLVEPKTRKQTGHGGSDFYLTEDKRFWVKTMVSEEVEVMHYIMPQYHQYIVESHAATLLPQYLAMYRTTVESKEYYYIVFRNVFNPANKIHRKYDLKGSKIDREAKDSEKEDEEATFKDNDFIQGNVKLMIDEETKEQVVAKLKKDVEFLSSLNVMDYSLLVGIHDINGDKSGKDGDKTEEEEEDGIVSENGGEHGAENGLENGVDSGTENGVENGFSAGEDSGDALGGPVSGEEDESFTNATNNKKGFDPDYYVVPSQSGSNEIYYISIIDVLSYYGATKRVAHAAKTMKHGSGAEISTVKPDLYASRFVEFIESIFE